MPNGKMGTFYFFKAGLVHASGVRPTSTALLAQSKNDACELSEPGRRSEVSADEVFFLFRWPGSVPTCARLTRATSSPAFREAAGVVSIARIERPQLFRLSLEGGLDGLPLRVSNEGLRRPRVARAQETI